MKKNYVMTEKTIDHVTGEVVESRHTSSKELPQEPAYVKLYLDHIAKLKSLPKNSSSILFSLVKHMNFSNTIIINSAVKRLIAEENNMVFQTVANAITKLTKDGILRRKDTGMYVLDPKLFAKGKWSDIEKLRDQYLELSITYHPNGKYDMKSEFFPLNKRDLKAM